MIVYLFEETRVELESFRELALDLTDAFEPLVENGADFFDVALSCDTVLNGCEESLCSFSASRRFLRRQKEFLG